MCEKELCTCGKHVWMRFGIRPSGRIHTCARRKVFVDKLAQKESIRPPNNWRVLHALLTRECSPFWNVRHHFVCALSTHRLSSYRTKHFGIYSFKMKDILKLLIFCISYASLSLVRNVPIGNSDMCSWVSLPSLINWSVSIISRSIKINRIRITSLK